MSNIPKLSQKYVPPSYFELSDDIKQRTHMNVYDKITKLLMVKLPNENERIDLIFKIIDISIEAHEEIEDYVVCQFWVDFKKYIENNRA